MTEWNLYYAVFIHKNEIKKFLKKTKESERKKKLFHRKWQKMHKSYSLLNMSIT